MKANHIAPIVVVLCIFLFALSPFFTSDGLDGESPAMLEWDQKLSEQLPSTFERAEHFISTHRNFTLVSYPLLVLAFFFPLWRLRGKITFAKHSEMISQPPPDMEPGYMVTMRKRDVTPQAFAADLMALAMHGTIALESASTGDLLVHDLKNDANLEKLSETLKNFHTALFLENAGTLDTRINPNAMANLIRTHQAGYGQRTQPLFRHNLLWNFLGIVLLLGYAIWTVPLLPGPLTRVNTENAYAYLSLMFLGTVCVAGAFVRAARALEHNPLGFMRFIFPAALGAFLYSRIPIWDFSITVALLAAATLALVFAYCMMPTMSAEGESQLAQIQGFKKYMDVIGQERLVITEPLDSHIEEFEQLFPYAVALDCEGPWGRRYAGLLTNPAYRPAWYADTKSYRASSASRRTKAVPVLTLAYSAMEAADLANPDTWDRMQETR